MGVAAASLFTLAVLAGLVACSKSAPPPGKPVKIADVCREPDKSRVRLEGFVRYRRGLMSFCSTYGGRKTCDLDLYDRPERPPEFDVLLPRTGPQPVIAKLSVPVGDGPGEMDELPKQFKASDIRLHLKSGANAVEGSHVLVDGTVTVVPGDPKTPSVPKTCYVSVEWVSAS